MKRFRRHVEHILDPTNRWNGDCYDEELLQSPRNPQPATSAGSDKKAYFEEHNLNEEEQKRKREQLVWFRVQYQELLSEVNDRIDELEGLREGAKSTADSVSSPPNHSLLISKTDMDLIRSTIFWH